MPGPRSTSGATSQWSLLTVTCICLFIGAMGKSAQVPLHVWLPDSMEGPTPISALIHAATMVTAGIFMVARMSPLFEHSDVGAVVRHGRSAPPARCSSASSAWSQFDIKRVVAYSTLSQLGYMTVALGVSAYAGAIFHLMTHAFFKALLFLGAGSVIIAMHHEQDMRNMGGLRKYMPITYVTMVIGGLALCGIPPFAGFFSKDAIIEAVHLSTIPGHGYAYFCVMAGVFVTAFYTFRLIFMTFHGDGALRPSADPGSTTRHDGHDDHEHHGGPPKESPWVVTVPLILLAIPSVVAGWIAIEPLLFGGYFGSSIVVLPAARRAGQAEGGMARRGRVHRARLAVDAVLDRARRHRFGDLPVSRQSRRCRPGSRRRWAASTRCSSTTITSTSSTSGSSPAVRAGSAACFSNVGDRKIIEGIVNGSARMVGWWARDAAADAVGLRLPLRVHDDHRPLRAADVVGDHAEP